MIRHLITAAACACLVACGGGAGPDPVFVTSGSAQAHRISVLVVGDSTMTPVYVGERATPDYVADLTGAAVTNLAVSGTTACQADLAAIRAARADVVVDNFAINDSGNSVEVYRECMGRIAAAAREAGSVLVLLQANRIVPGGQWSHARSNDAIAVMEAEKRAIAIDTGGYYCAQPALPWSLDLVPDGVHPGGKAKPAIAATLADCIGRAL